MRSQVEKERQDSERSQRDGDVGRDALGANEKGKG